MSTFLYRFSALACTALALAGCANKSYVVLLEDPQGGVGKVVVSGEKGSQTLDKAMYAANLDGRTAPQPVEARRFQEDFGAVLAARPPLPARYLLYFELGGTELTQESRALLPRVLEDFKNRPAAEVSVIGHTDTVGSVEANQTLALQRAKEIAALLVEQGLQLSVMSVESHGERNLLVPTPDETDEPRNRRVEISVR